jgi:hypothetical protein
MPKIKRDNQPPKKSPYLLLVKSNQNQLDQFVQLLSQLVVIVIFEKKQNNLLSHPILLKTI